MQDLLETYLPIIQRNDPHIKKDEIKLLPGGNAHIVFLVKNNVFRFPKTKGIEARQHIENEFVKSINTPITLPKLCGYTDELTGTNFQKYTYIPGEPFTKYVATKLTEAELKTIAKSFGQFLANLHLFSTNKLQGLNTNSPTNSEEYARYYITIFDEDKKRIGNLLTNDEWKWVEKNIANYYELTIQHPFQLNLIHGDILPKHILIDEETHRLNGVIDFNLRIGDPANDFRYFDRYGEIFLKTVYDNYLPVDTFFDNRRKFHSGDLLVAYLYLATDTKNEIMKVEYLHELKEYIATHPF